MHIEIQMKIVTIAQVECELNVFLMSYFVQVNNALFD